MSSFIATARECQTRSRHDQYKRLNDIKSATVLFKDWVKLHLCYELRLRCLFDAIQPELMSASLNKSKANEKLYVYEMDINRRRHWLRHVGTSVHNEPTFESKKVKQPIRRVPDCTGTSFTQVFVAYFLF